MGCSRSVLPCKTSSGPEIHFLSAPSLVTSRILHGLNVVAGCLGFQAITVCVSSQGSKNPAQIALNARTIDASSVGTILLISYADPDLCVTRVYKFEIHIQRQFGVGPSSSRAIVEAKRLRSGVTFMNWTSCNRPSGSEDGSESCVEYGEYDQRVDIA